MVHETLLARTESASGSHPRRLFSIGYPLTESFHGRGRGFESVVPAAGSAAQQLSR